MAMWKDVELDEEVKAKMKKLPKFKQNVTTKDECEIFEAEDVSDVTTSSDDDDLDDLSLDDEDDEKFGEDMDPIAAI